MYIMDFLPLHLEFSTCIHIIPGNGGSLLAHSIAGWVEEALIVPT